MKNFSIPIDWRDVAFILGAGVFVAGVAMIYRPAALIVAGAAIAWFALYGKS